MSATIGMGTITSSAQLLSMIYLSALANATTQTTTASIDVYRTLQSALAMAISTSTITELQTKTFLAVLMAMRTTTSAPELADIWAEVEAVTGTWQEVGAATGTWQEVGAATGTWEEVH